MTLFAGVVGLRPARELPQGCARILSENLSRHPDDRPRIVSGEGFVLAYANLGLLDGDGLHAGADGRISVVAGEPLQASVARPRTEDLRELHESWLQQDERALRAATGSFCAAHFDPHTRGVRLAADKLALRPLYYSIVDGLLVFGTSLRIVLAAMPKLGARADLTAQTQLAALKHVLGARTPYADVLTVEAGCLIEVHGGVARARRYFGWDEVEQRDSDEADFSRRMYAAFIAAVRRRLGTQRAVVAQLSGGLDSRCVVASLRELDVEVHSINFAPGGSADQVLGRHVGERLGTRHFEAQEGPLDFWRRMASTHEAWLRSMPAEQRPSLPARIWTGFGGGDVVAPTNIPEAILPAMREGRPHDAIDAYLERVGGRLPNRLFVRHRRKAMREQLLESMQAQLATHTAGDPARRFHAFLMQSEMRGNLASHHEDLDLRRFEFVMPYCDAEFVALSLTCPLERLLRHRFYYRWLQHFPAAVGSTAWQAYPWSEPCPIPAPSGLRQQWGEGWYGQRERKAEIRQLLEQAALDLDDPRFPHALLDRRMLRVAYLLARSGITRYMHLLSSARIYLRYARHAAGE